MHTRTANHTNSFGAPQLFLVSFSILPLCFILIHNSLLLEWSPSTLHCDDFIAATEPVSDLLANSGFRCHRHQTPVPPQQSPSNLHTVQRVKPLTSTIMLSASLGVSEPVTAFLIPLFSMRPCLSPPHEYPAYDANAGYEIESANF